MLYLNNELIHEISKLQVFCSLISRKHQMIQKILSHFLLIGICNNDQSDDFTKRDGEITGDRDEFGMSWLSVRKSKQCFPKPNPPCKQDPAVQCEIIRSDVFLVCIQFDIR